ncbi:phage gp6-like head-tail connector protein [Ensifer sp. PDNC004]|uniref:head-tail connector protein n=1 Tax=Ensifer sp. PDNC004 TaxID=2811423 RepID=UPI0019651806|nr:head-tail connector protein [Ensifer sp. PDNC004]QRY66549.1 phage gp6-like head-tail connector protein [Ensifer sp. PDNC004]
MIVDLAHVKENLNIVSNDDDALLRRQIEAAEAHINRLLGFKMDVEFPGDTVPADLKQAIFQLVGHWYENRETSLVGVSIVEVPFSVREIVREHRNWTF